LRRWPAATGVAAPAAGIDAERTNSDLFSTAYIGCGDAHAPAFSTGEWTRGRRGGAPKAIVVYG
jgi:hypothetical protein